MRRLLTCLAITVVACTGGRDKLLADLQSARPEERAQALKKLSEQHNSDDLVLFTQAARDPVPMVRGEAIAALGKSDDPRVVDLLGELLGDADETVQAHAAMALAQVGNEKARSYLTLQYHRRGRATRQAIVQALTATNVPGAMASVVAAEAKSIWDRNLQTLTDGTLPERVGAAEELGRSGRPEAVNRLVPLLKDSQVILAAAAVRGLGNAGDKRSVGPISELLKESYPQLREAACEALMQLKDEAALPRLLEVANEKSPVSSLAVVAIGALPPSTETDKALCDITLNAAPAEALAAGQQMRKRKGCPLEPIVDKLKNQSTIPNTLQALAALGPLAKDAAPKVVPLLTTSDAAIRRLAVEALLELGDAQSAPAVLKAFEAEVKALEPQRSHWVTVALPQQYGKGFDPSEPIDPNDPDSALRAKQQDLFRKVQVVAENKAKESNRTLLQPNAPRELVDDASEEQLKVLAALVRALGALKVDNARALVEPFAREASPSLRAAAYESLAALGAEGVALARPGLLDGERSVQGATANALARSGEAGQVMILETLAQLTGDRSRLLEPLKDATLTAASVPNLLALLRDGGAEAGTAALMLGKLKAKEAVEPVLKALDDSTAVARRELLLAAGGLQDPRALEVVAKDLYNESSDVRAAAAEALQTLGPGKHTDELLALKVDYYRKVRDSAQTALNRAAPDAKH